MLLKSIDCLTDHQRNVKCKIIILLVLRRLLTTLVRQFVLKICSDRVFHFHKTRSKQQIYI